MTILWVLILSWGAMNIIVKNLITVVKQLLYENDFFNVKYMCYHQHGCPPGTRIDHMEANLQTVPRSHDVCSDHCLVHRIDRLNYTFINQYDNYNNQLAYIHNYPQNKSGGFYFLTFSCETGQLTILECLSYPVDVLQVCDSIWLCIYPRYFGSTYFAY